MLTNLLKDRVLLIKKTITQGVLGKTETYIPVGWKYASVKPLSAQARVQYQQLNSVVEYEVTMRKGDTITLGNYKIKWGNKTLEPSAPMKELDDSIIIPCKEL